MNFCFERLKFWYTNQNIHPNIFEAVLAKSPHAPFDFHNRIQAVDNFKKLPEANALATANKRVQKILAKEKSFDKNQAINPNIFEKNAEQELFKAIINKEQEIHPLVKNFKYSAVLKSLAALQTPIDNFFDNVMVMVDDSAIKNNRLNLLFRVRLLFLEVADISML